MVNDLVPVFVIVAVLLGAAAIMIAYRRRRGRLEFKYGDASITYASQRAPERPTKGFVVQESDVNNSTFDVPQGADARIDSSRFRKSRLTIRDQATPGQQTDRRTR